MHISDLGQLLRRQRAACADRHRGGTRGLATRPRVPDHAGHHRKQAAALIGGEGRVLKVFLSSTAKDLEPHRVAVDAAIRKLEGLHSVRMEDWTARPDTPRETCEAEVRGSGLFIGILGPCY